jgi:hypothetical protein
MIEIGSISSAFGIAEKMFRLAGWARQKFSQSRQISCGGESKRRFELRPMTFKVDLMHQLPYVEVRFYVINYHEKPLNLIEAKIFSLQLSNGLNLESIPLWREDIHVAPLSATPIWCRRNLTDAECRAMSHMQDHQSASYELSAKSHIGSRISQFGPVSSLAIEGRVVGPAQPSLPADVAVPTV